jgi:microcystin-dependent protein
MSEPYVGEIRMFAGNFAPRGWALCEGQLLDVSSNDALFSLLGTIYGGDGRTTFGLPDMRGRVPLHAGSTNGPGLSPRRLGEKGGTEDETLTVQELPSHTHPMRASTSLGNTPGPAKRVPATATSFEAYINEAPTQALAPDAITAVGGSRSHTNLQPSVCVYFIIALVGIYPSRN